MTVASVRAARPDDAGAIADAHVRGWLTTYRGIVPDHVLDGLSVEQRAAWWRDAISVETAAATAAEPATAASLARTWVVEVDGHVRGFASTGSIRDQPDGLDGAGEVFAIYLSPEARGRGLGRRLFEHAVTDLRVRGFAPVVVWVFEANTDAQRFYGAAGFRPDGARQPVDFGEVALPEVRYRLG